MIDSKQFIIGKNMSHLPENWQTIQLGNGFQLCYQQELRIWHSDDGRVVLLGHAWQTDPCRGTPEDEIGSVVRGGCIIHEDVYEVEKTWCGRYLLIVDDWIYLDSSGLLGVFYSNCHVSSSLHVLCGIEGREIIYPPIEHRKSPDFVPGAATCYDGVKRLLPSQIYNYVKGEVKIRPLLPDGIIHTDSDQSRISLFEKYFVHSLKNMQKHFEGIDLWLALTGGRDSRVTMASLERAGIPYHSFTLEHGYISAADRKIPFKITKKLKRPHLFISRADKKFSQKRYDDYKVHSSGMAVDEDWRHYAFSQYDDLLGSSGSDSVVILRSGVWESVCDFFRQFCKSDYNLRELFPFNSFVQSLDEWYSYVKADKNNEWMTIWDRTYFDLRLGCWLSSVEQSCDIMDGMTFIQPCNSRIFISILLGFDRIDRIAKKHEEKMVSSLCPSIASIPYDYQYYRTFMLMKRAIGKIIRKVWHGKK